MADYRKLATDLIASDGKIDEAELKLLRKHLYADKTIDKEEVTFLMEVRASVARRAKTDAAMAKFDTFLLKAVGDYLEKAGSISDEDVALVKKVTGAAKVSDAEKKRFLAKATKDTRENAGIKKLHDDFAKKSGKK